MKQFLEINGQKYPIADVLKALDIKDDVRLVRLCQQVPSGNLAAEVGVYEGKDDYPHIRLLFHSDIPNLGDVDIALAEQLTGDGSARVFLYGRGDSYIAYMPIDLRTDDEIDADGLKSVVVISGDCGDEVTAAFENGHYTTVPYQDFNRWYEENITKN